MKITWEDHDTFYQRLAAPFNPPSDEDYEGGGCSSGDSKFDIEFDDVYERLEAILDARGVNDHEGYGDFYLDHSVCQSRGIGFVSSHEFATTELLQAIQLMLWELDEDWEISIQEMNYDWAILIGRTFVAIHAGPEFEAELRARFS